MVVLDEGPLEPVKRGVRFVAERVDLGNLDRRSFRVLVDDCLKRGVRIGTSSQAEERERDAGLAFPVDPVLLEFRQRLGMPPLIKADAAQDRVMSWTVANTRSFR